VEDSSTSSVAVIFYAEFPSVFAGNTVEFSDPQLFDRCAGGITWVGPDEVVLGIGKSVTTTLDDNGNAFVVALAGPSCASGETLAQADLVAPTYRTLTTCFRVLSPRVTVQLPHRPCATARGGRAGSVEAPVPPPLRCLPPEYTEYRRRTGE
jgi:hypothetical protein